MQTSDGNPMKNNYLDFIQNNLGDFLSDFEETQRNKKKKRGRKPKVESTGE
jgi:hypothetical protein